MNILSVALAVIIISSHTVISFTIHHQEVKLYSTAKTTLSMAMFDFGSSKIKIPVSLNDRDNQAIGGIKAAINYKNIPLIECEFPPLGSLNKLGDGSLRSALEVEEVRIRLQYIYFENTISSILISKFVVFNNYHRLTLHS